MPVRYPDEFRQRAIELARSGDQSVAKVAADLGIATSCLRRWMKQDDIDGGRREGLSTDERAECQRPLGIPHWRPIEFPGDGHENSPRTAMGFPAPSAG